MAAHLLDESRVRAALQRLGATSCALALAAFETDDIWPSDEAFRLSWRGNLFAWAFGEPGELEDAARRAGMLPPRFAAAAFHLTPDELQVLLGEWCRDWSPTSPLRALVAEVADADEPATSAGGAQ